MPSGVYERTPAHREQMSLARKGRSIRQPKCEDGCLCGKHDVFSPERRQKISQAKAGKRRDGTPAHGSYVDAHGYRILTGQWAHPLVVGNGEVKEHRKVLYDKIGPGTHHCHWCYRLVEWISPYRNTDLCVDHLDDDRLNNEAENLVPSCFRCNWNRSNPKMRGK